MARIEDSKPKDSSGGYERLFGIPELGLLISRLQSTVISSGTELERIIISRVPRVDDLDAFLQQERMQEGVFIAPKKQVKQSKTLDFPSGEPDFLIFKRRDERQFCHAVELKDGHAFDTKKARAEKEAMHSFIRQTGARLPYRMSCHFCSFNQDDREAIVAGFKRAITLEEAMTGREFCNLLEIDYDDIVESRRQHQPENVRYFLSELVGITEVRAQIQALLEQRAR